MSENEMSPEEKKKAEFEKLQKVQMEALLANSVYIGANAAKLWGDKGKDVADSYFNYGDGFKARQKDTEETKNLYEKLGINYEAEFTSAGKIILNAIKTNSGAQGLLTLGSLEKIVDTVNPAKDFKVADKFRNYTGMQVLDLMQKDKSKLSDEQKDVISTYNLLSSCYTDGSALSFMLKYSQANENAVGKEIYERNTPKNENSKESGEGKGKK